MPYIPYTLYDFVFDKYAKLHVYFQLPRWLVRFVKCLLHQRCLPGCCCCYVTDDIDDDDVDGEWTKVIGPWLDCDWQDVVDALDFVLFWIFLILTITSTTVAFSFSVSHIQIFS